MGSGVAVGACMVVVTMFATPVFAAASLEAGMLSSTASGASNRVSLGLRFGPVEPHKPDAEFSITAFAGTQESSASDGSILGAAGAMLDLGMARAFATGRRAAFVPRVSISALSAVGEGGARVAMGLHGGLSFVTLPEHGTGLRIDAGYRRLALPQDLESLWSLSAGLLWGYGREPASDGGGR